MDELILGVVFGAIVIAFVVLGRERSVGSGAVVPCPDTEMPVEIRGGVCRELESQRVVGIAWYCHRQCLLPRGCVLVLGRRQSEYRGDPGDEP